MSDLDITTSLLCTFGGSEIIGSLMT